MTTKLVIVGEAHLLDKLIADGIVWVDGNEYVGRASDGAEVNIGWNRKSAETYVEFHPSPAEW